ncbi:MAG: hypothetical protein NVSMB6_22990 [Burkholderiaceae bacterium]
MVGLLVKPIDRQVLRALRPQKPPTAVVTQWLSADKAPYGCANQSIGIWTRVRLERSKLT